MKKITSLLSVVLINIALINNLAAQDDHLSCGSSEENNKIFESNPKIKEAYLKREAELALQDKAAFANGYQESNSRAANQVYIIPIVFHILNQGGSENISDAQINDEVKILNQDYRKLNTDISAVVTSFKSLTADCEIEFRLAKKSPTGAATTGIDRITTPLTNNADNNSKLNDWPSNKYLNVWVVKTIGTAGVAGYSYYPGVTTDAYDGVLILHSYIGSIGTGSKSHSRALTHEIGHWLNLPHTWGSTNDPEVACGDDGVSDTPLTKGHKSCKLSDAVCTPGVIENVQNYMEYSYCCNMFTAGQKSRMRTALMSPTGGRNNVWTSTNLVETGITLTSALTTADFKSDQSQNIVCQGNSLSFTDLSWNGIPTTYSWTFQGGTPATATSSSPTVTYNTPGTYNVSLTVSNSSSSASATKTGFIKVYPSSAMISSSSYAEGFEGSAIPNTNWQVNNINPGSNTWVQSSATSSSGSKCVNIINATTSDGHIDELISPSIDMTKIVYAPSPSPYLSFKLAYAQKLSTNNDKLEVLVSSDCGQTWALQRSYIGSVLSSTNGALVTNSFVPTATQWKSISINLGSQKVYKNLFIMFRFTSDQGNNIYIDDINMGSNVGIEEEIAKSINLNIYPNPLGSDENATIVFDLLDNQKTDIAVYDVYGRKVSSIYSGNLNAGSHQFIVNTDEKLSSGVYFIRLSVGGESFAKKIIVE
jgi:PKD repeat protein